MIRNPKATKQRGQSVVFALLALLILSFAGALFIGIVTRNIGSSGHSSHVTSADFFAKAGLQFADTELTTSLDGADWRPPTQTVLTNDPDYDLVSKGFTRYDYGDGRFLLKVIYDPVNAATGVGQNLSELNRFIKVISVGRIGVVDPTDPTTFNHGQNPLNDTLVGYKQIGLTDYARFITDPDNTGAVASIGVPSIISGASDTPANSLVVPGVRDFAKFGDTTLTQYPVATNIGASDAYISTGGVLTVNPFAGTGKVSTNVVPGGGSFRSNDSVRFYGFCNFYLDRNLSSLPAIDTEGVEVAGNILEDNFNSANASSTGSPSWTFTPNTQSALVNATVATSSTTQASAFVMPSAYQGNSGFLTYNGAVRDGGTGANEEDSVGNPRAVKRLPPPAMDAVDALSGLPRYKAITTTCQPWLTKTQVANWVNPTLTPDEAGYGVYTYINNSSDIQSEASGSLSAQWLDESKPGWHQNDTYDPPGARIVFGPTGYNITRSDLDHNSNPILFPDSTGSTAATAGSQTFSVSYATIDSSTNKDVIIYAEGNVRLSGVVSAINDPHHVTVVTNGTAYIDGSLLKGDPDSSIAVLAHDYVCINTTQFLAGTSPLPLPLTVTPPDGYTQPAYTGPSGAVVANAFSSNTGTTPNNYVHIQAAAAGSNDNVVLQEFNFGLSTPTRAVSETPTTTYNAASVEYLYVSGQQDGAAAGTDTTATFNLYTGSATPNTILIPPGTFNQVNTTIFHTTLAPTTSISGLSPLQFVTLSVDVPAGTGPGFELERAAVLPGDVRIEAILFAQTRSFFVIPGQWFNSTTTDNLQAYTSGGSATAQHNDGTLPASQNRYPFYGQPIDLKITIAGSVVEAHPADPGAQAQWMQHWGWIPQFHGSLNELSGHNYGAGTSGPSLGLTFIYDPFMGYPYDQATPNKVINGNSYPPYIRYDGNANPLPIAPKLPCCPGFVYEDEINGPTPVT